MAWNERTHAQLHRVMDRDGHACVYCTIPLLCFCEMSPFCDESGAFVLSKTGPQPALREHVIPKSRGGSDEDGNIVPACNQCNTSKGARTPEEWRAAQARRSA